MRKTEIAAERERQRKLEAATVATLQPGEMQPERDFNQQGEKTSVVRADGRPGRGGAGWFSYDMPVDPGQPMALVVTYHSDTRRVRSFDDEQHLAAQPVRVVHIGRFGVLRSDRPSHPLLVPPDLVLR